MPGHANGDGGDEVLPDMLARSPKMRELGELVKRFASSDATVLLLGETGTGKGARGARIASAQSAVVATFHRGELRGDSRRATRKRALRLHEGIFHGREQRSARLVRRGEQGNTISRRNRRNAPLLASQADTSARGACNPALGRIQGAKRSMSASSPLLIGTSRPWPRTKAFEKTSGIG